MKNRLREQELSAQRAQIVRDYHRVYDPALIEKLLDEPNKLGLELGEGRHFRSYIIRTQGAVDLALNVAKSSFGSADTRLRKSWVLRMQKLQRLAHPLLPPYALIERNEELAYVLPYCEKDLPPKSWAELELMPWIEDFKATLAAQGLCLDDYMQVRACKQHPFVIDYSDLIELR